jgi:predicted  nucleic acid-binding Zn-ribbon protein
MPHITTCARCGKAYEETSEETANAPAWCSERLCRKCEKALVDRIGRVRRFTDQDRR